MSNPACKGRLLIEFLETDTDTTGVSHTPIVSLNLQTGALTYNNTPISFAYLLAGNKEGIFCEGIPINIQFISNLECSTHSSGSLSTDHDPISVDTTTKACVSTLSTKPIQSQFNKSLNTNSSHSPTDPLTTTTPLADQPVKTTSFSIYEDNFQLDYIKLERNATLPTKSAYTTQTLQPYPSYVYALRTPFDNTMLPIPQGYEHMSLKNTEYIAHFLGSDINDDLRRNHAIVEGRINDTPLHILMDTGADISVLHAHVADMVALEVFTHNSIDIAAFGGDSTSTNTTAKVKISLDDAVYFGEFWLCNFDPCPK